MPLQLTEESTISDLSTFSDALNLGGTDKNVLVLDVQQNPATTIFSTLAAAGSNNEYFISISKIPNLLNWGSGTTYTLNLNITQHAQQIGTKISAAEVIRISSSGTILARLPGVSVNVDITTNGVKTISITDSLALLDLPASAAITDRIVLVFHILNGSALLADSYAYEVGVIANSDIFNSSMKAVVPESLSDSLSFVESMSAIKNLKQLSDTLSFTEAVKKAVNKIISDAVNFVKEGVTNEQILGAGANVTPKPTELLQFIDLITKNINKRFNDAITLTDTAIATKNLKNISDSDAITESIIKNLGKSLLFGDLGSTGGTNSTAAPGVGFLYAQQISTLLPNQEFNSIAINISVPAGSIRVKVYDDSAGAPNNLLAESNSLVSVNTGFQYFPLNKTSVVPANGIVWVAYETNSNALILFVKTVSNGTDRANHVYGTGPNPFGAVTLVNTQANMKLSSGMVFIEAISRNIGKAVSDAVSVSENLSKSIVKSVIDNLTFSQDNVLKSVGKAISDSPAITDIISKKLNKSLQDNIVITDVINRTITKIIPLSDPIIITDIINRSITKIVPLSDSIVITDITSKKLNKLLQDNVVISDIIISSISRLITESIIESISLSDDITAVLLHPAVVPDIGTKTAGVFNPVYSTKDKKIMIITPITIRTKQKKTKKELLFIMTGYKIGKTSNLYLLSDKSGKKSRISSMIKSKHQVKAKSQILIKNVVNANSDMPVYLATNVKNTKRNTMSIKSPRKMSNKSQLCIKSNNTIKNIKKDKLVDSSVLQTINYIETIDELDLIG